MWSLRKPALSKMPTKSSFVYIQASSECVKSPGPCVPDCPLTHFLPGLYDLWTSWMATPWTPSGSIWSSTTEVHFRSSGPDWDGAWYWCRTCRTWEPSQFAGLITGRGEPRNRHPGRGLELSSPSEKYNTSEARRQNLESAYCKATLDIVSGTRDLKYLRLTVDQIPQILTASTFLGR